MASPGQLQTQDRIVKSYAQPKNTCEVQIVFEGRTKVNDGDMMRLDSDCDDVWDVAVLRPDDKSKPVMVLFDGDQDRVWDGYVLDQNHDGRWDVSYWDRHAEFDGLWRTLCGVRPMRGPGRRSEVALNQTETQYVPGAPRAQPAYFPGGS
jgi:hypothetical protein